jgi:hypothetical protein
LRTALRLDIFIEILLRTPVNRANTKDRDFSAPSLFMRVDNAPSCCLPPRGWRGSGECPGVVGHHVARFVLDSSEADLFWRAHLLMAASPRPRRAVHRAVVAAKDVAAPRFFFQDSRQGAGFDPGGDGLGQDLPADLDAVLARDQVVVAAEVGVGGVPALCLQCGEFGGYPRNVQCRCL